MKKIILSILSLLIFLSNADARYWTNQEGRIFEGDLVEADDNSVTIRRTSDRRKFTLNLADLSQGDQDYLKELAEKKKLEEQKKAEAEAKKKKPTSSKDRLPTSEKKLAEWLVGTEWVTTGSQRWIRRFYKDGRMKFQSQHKWVDSEKDTRQCKYQVMDKRTVYISTGIREFTIIFDGRYKSFKSKSKEKDFEIEGELKGRF